MGVRVLYIDHRYNHIHIDWDIWDDLAEVTQWCLDNDGFTMYSTGIVFHTDNHLTLFLLRWANDS